MNKLNAVILAPVMPIWDQGNFCKQLVNQLQLKNYKVTVIDTLSLINSDSTEKAIDVISNELNRQMNEPSLLIGFAMGGTLAQMVANKIQKITGIISISAPGFADLKLKQNIGSIIALLDEGNLESALDKLHEFVVPEGKKVTNSLIIPQHLREHSVMRMKIGFSLLLNFDARKTMRFFNGKYLGIVGEKSQLATTNNQTNTNNINHTYAFIPNAGMRPWDDNPLETNFLINSWIEKL